MSAHSNRIKFDTAVLVGAAISRATTREVHTINLKFRGKLKMVNTDSFHTARRWHVSITHLTFDTSLSAYTSVRITVDLASATAKFSRRTNSTTFVFFSRIDFVDSGSSEHGPPFACRNGLSKEKYPLRDVIASLRCALLW